MNCEECKAQVFELIEREATDPDAVNEVLARCPECRALFDQMKAAVQTASELPLETPPDALDEQVLRAAAARNADVVPLRSKRRFITPPWAAAAVALLAVGVGVWAIPRADETAFERVETTADEEAFALEESELAAPAAEVAAAPEPAAPSAKVAERRGGARPESAARSSAPRAKRKTASDTSSTRVADSLEEDVDARQAYSGASAEVVAAPAAEANERSRAVEAKKERRQMSPKCEAHVARFEALAIEHELGAIEAITPEHALALGRCYADVGEVEDARMFLELAAAHPETKKRAIRALRALPKD
jgi:hypothetical protein